jgi:hypothetical protein
MTDVPFACIAGKVSTLMLMTPLSPMIMAYKIRASGVSQETKCFAERLLS